MTKRQKIILLVVFMAALVPVARFLWISYLELRMINPEIYPAFRRVENYSLRYIKAEKDLHPREYVRCKRVADEVIRIRYKMDDYRPTDSQYYGFLRSFDFELPPYVPERPASLLEHYRAWREASRLIEEQDAIFWELYAGGEKRD